MSSSPPGTNLPHHTTGHTSKHAENKSEPHEGLGILGSRVEILWQDTPDGDVWYPGVVKEFDVERELHLILYDDGDTDWYNLATIEYKRLDAQGRVIEEKGPSSSSSSSSSSSPEASGNGTDGAAGGDGGGDGDKGKKGADAAMDLLGKRVEVLWEGDEGEDDSWYPAVVKEYNIESKQHLVEFDDGDVDWYDLQSIAYRMVAAEPAADAKAAAAPLAEESKDATPAAAAAAEGKAAPDSKEDAAGSADESKGVGDALASRDAPPRSNSRSGNDGGNDGGADTPATRRAREWKAAVAVAGPRDPEPDTKSDDAGGSGAGTSIGGVRALRLVHEHMLRERYSMTWEQRWEEYVQLMKRGGAQNIEKPTAALGDAAESKTMSDRRRSTKSREEMRRKFMELKSEHEQMESERVLMLPGAVAQSGNAASGAASAAAAAAAAAGSDVNGRSGPGIGGDESKFDGDIATGWGGDQWKDEAHAEQMLLPDAPVPPPSAEFVGDHEANIEEILQRVQDEVTQLDDVPLAHLKAFDEEVPTQELVIAAVPLEQVEAQERRLEAERHEEAQAEMRAFKRREQEVLAKEQRARDRVMADLRGGRVKLRRSRVGMLRQQRLEEERLRTQFQSAEEKLRTTLERQKAVVQERVGDLNVAHDSGRVAFRRVGVQWKRLPQLLELRLHHMRAVRDRLPSGKYVMLVTLFDRLGGHPLHWSALGPSGAGKDLPAATAPIRHRGRFYDVKMDFNQSIYVVCPSRSRVRPAMVLVLELFMLGTKTAPTDRVVAWSALPLADVNYDVVHGKYRLPLLFGNMGMAFDKYEKIEETYSKDLNNWLCNLYLEVCHVPKQVLLNGMSIHEFDVKLDFTRTLLNLRGRAVSSDDVGINDDDDDDDDNKDNGSDDKKGGGGGSGGGRGKEAGGKGKGGQENDNSGVVGAAAFAKPDAEDAYLFAVNRSGGISQSAPNASHGVHSETVQKLHFLKYELIADFGIQRWGHLEFWVMLFIIVFSSWLRMYVHFLGQWLYLKAMNVAVYDLRPFWYACVVKYTSETIPIHIEVGAVIAGQAINIVLFILLMLVAWMWQRFARFPDILSRFVMGFGFSTTFDAVLILIVDLASNNFNCQAIPVCAADKASNDCVCSEGDAFKLWFRFVDEEGSGVVGLIVTVLIDICLFLLAGILFFNYLTSLHFNGRVVDIFRRLTALESSFFLPRDLEMSTSELRWICSKANRWRGPDGSKRKITVSEFVMTDPLVPDFKEVSTHLAIYILAVDGTRTLYRQFLRYPDGAIVEVFGSMLSTASTQFSALETLMKKSGVETDADLETKTETKKRD